MVDKETTKYRRKSRRKESFVETLAKAQQIVFAPFTFQVIASMMKFGILDYLKSTSASIEEIVQNCDISKYTAKTLCEAALVTEIIELKDGKYSLTSLGDTFIDNEMTRVNFNFMRDVCYLGASELANSFKEESPIGLKKYIGNYPTIYPALSKLPEQIQKSWYEFDHYYSDNCFDEVLDIIFKQNPKEIFDIGGNTGKFEKACLKYNSDCKVTMLDLPENIDRALCDFAGVSSSDVTKYIAGFRLQAVKSQEIKNPFSKDIIEVGNAPDDKVQYYDFFDMSKVDSSMKSKPLYIHLDMSLSGDRTGIAGVWIKGKRPPKEGETSSKDLYYQLAFSIAIKAPRGYQVSFEKNRQFIYWLKENGFRIKGVSSDTYQSADLKQQLIAKGYKYDIISVDRVDTLDDGKTKLCKPYHYFRNTIYEERILMYDSELLTTELLGLEKNSVGRVDHPDSGTHGSKDCSDAVCGALWNASQHADEFEFDYGESLNDFVNVNAERSSLNEREQMIVDFQEELRKVFGSTHPRPENSPKEKNEYSLYAALQDGIII